MLVTLGWYTKPSPRWLGRESARHLPAGWARLQRWVHAQLDSCGAFSPCRRAELALCGVRCMALAEATVACCTSCPPVWWPTSLTPGRFRASCCRNQKPGASGRLTAGTCNRIHTFGQRARRFVCTRRCMPRSLLVRLHRRCHGKDENPRLSVLNAVHDLYFF